MKFEEFDKDFEDQIFEQINYYLRQKLPGDLPIKNVSLVTAIGGLASWVQMSLHHSSGEVS